MVFAVAGTITVGTYIFVLQCDEKVTTDRMFEQLQQSPVKLGWLGSGCSVATAVTALWTQLYNLTQVSIIQIAIT